MDPLFIPQIRNITISGRIGSGATTLAKNLGNTIGWRVLEGGEILGKFHKDSNIPESRSDKRPDEIDLKFEERVGKILQEENQEIIQSHLAGFSAQGVPGIFKILVVVEDKHGKDMQDIRIDRLVNRKEIGVGEARKEILEREKNNLEKWTRLYANNDPKWVYWDRKYYDLVINTFSNNSNESLDLVLKKLGI